MIDLHCHILHGLDDGASDLDESLALATAAANAGTSIMVATPHIRDDYPFDHALIAERTGLLNRELAKAGIALEVLAGGEVSLTKSAEMTDAELNQVALAGGPYLLVEGPYTDVGHILEAQLNELHARGFELVLAHPERSPSLCGDLDRVSSLVARGILCSITAGSMAGQFGRTVQRYTIEMLAAGLVHNVASDAHDARHRGPDLMHGFHALERSLPGITERARWFTGVIPSVVVAGAKRPPEAPSWNVSKRRRGRR